MQQKPDVEKVEPSELRRPEWRVTCLELSIHVGLKETCDSCYIDIFAE